MTDLDLPAEDLGLPSSPPPRNTRAEMFVLGAMMGASQLADVDEIAELLDPSDFYEPKHATIFGAIVDLAVGGKDRGPVRPEPLTVLHHLGEEGPRIGGPGYLQECLAAPESFMSGPHYAAIVAELGQRRRVLDAGMKLMALARKPGPTAEVVEAAQQATYEATTRHRDRTIVTSVGDLIDPAIERMESIARGEIQPGLPTGLAELDRITGGMKPGQLWIPAGRTSMGKSVATQNWLGNAAKVSQRPVILFSLEMSADEMMNRLVSEIARVPLYLINEGRYDSGDRRRIEEARDQVIYGLPLYLVDNVRTTPAIRSYCRRFQQKHGDLAAVGVDYLQFVQPVAGKRRPDRHIEVGEWAREFKTMGQDMGFPVIAPCQLNRNPEARQGGKDKGRPQLSDMRESGDLEQTADVAVLIHRPDYYDKDSPRAGEADMIVAKNRNGPTDTVTVGAQLHIQRFVDMAPAPTWHRGEPPEPGPWD